MSNDPAVETRFTRLFARCSEVERLRMTCAMFDDAKALIAAGVKAARPDISSQELRVATFDRLYGDECEPKVRARLIERILAETETGKSDRRLDP